MTQLSTLEFSQGGSLVFDTKDNVSGIGSSNVVDLETQHANMESPDFDHTMAFVQIGPFHDAKSHLLSWLDTYEGKSELSPLRQGARKLLRLFIEWSIMRTEINGRKPFVLAHADLDSQNVFVDDEGNLTGVIDWDGVAAVPLCIGPQSLPKFLTEDYDPNHYDYDVEAGEPRAGRIADSPEELTSYRAMYAQFIESYLSDKDRTAMVKSPRQARVVRMARKKAADMTRRSLITNNLQLAAKAPSQMEELMEHLFEEIAQLTAAKWGATPSTAISRAPGDREEGVKEIGDTKAGVVRNTGGAEEKPCVDSPEFEGTAVNVEGLSIDELMDKVGELTSASEVKKTSGSKETSCIGSPASDVATVNIEDLSLDELMDKIEELTGRLSANDSESDTKQDLADFQDDPSAEEKIPEPKHEAHVLNAESDKKIAHREHRVNVSVLPCSPQKTNVDLEKYNRVQKKLRRGANHLHKQPKKDNTMAKAEPTSKVRPVRIASNFCGWTDKKLRRVACCLYCDNGDDKDKARIESMIETVQTGAIDVLEGLRAKLEQLIQTLHRQENKSSVSSENSEEKASQTQNATTAIRELTKADERSICGKFVHMVQDKQLHLTGDQQVAIAHGIMQMLKDLNLSDSSVGSTEACPHNKSECREVDVNGGHGDPENDSGYNGSDAEGEDVHGGAEETGQHDIGENSREPMDRARTDTARIDSGEENSNEVSMGAVAQKAPKVEPTVDTGAFNLSDICVTLSKGDLDKRRMRRLRDGFLGLLNQSKIM